MLAAALLLALAPADGGVIQVRGGLPRFAAAVAAGGPVRVVFFGGSITERDGFRPRVEAGLRARFPAVDWQFENRGVASTGSLTGLFRYHEGGMHRGERPPPALVIAESAVNDDQDERLSYEDAVWAKEGFVREAAAPADGFVPADAERWAVPDLLLVHFPNPAILEALRAGTIPAAVAAHEAVAAHYDLPSVNVAAEVARRTGAGTLTWEEYGGTHPGPVGDELAAELILSAIDRGVTAAPNSPPDRPRWERPRLRDDSPDRAATVGPFAAGFFGVMRADRDGWQFGIPRWGSTSGKVRSRFREVQFLHATEPGATLTFPSPDHEGPFTPHALALYILAGPDAGALEVAVPGEPPRTVELYHDPYSADLHYPRTVLLYRGAEPPAGAVTVTTRAGVRGGTAVRILGIGVGVRAAASDGAGDE